MLQPSDKVVVGVSGGADSVCLLLLLLAYAKRVPISLAVCHVNHGIRKEAGEDAAYVEVLCRQQRLPFYLKNADVRARAAEKRCSEEEAGRCIRYETFEEIATEIQANKIAVAHNCNDRSETMLFHLFRGTGVKGLASIQPVRESVIRPILCLKREEIEEYLSEAGISYCTDATNAEDSYTRNRIRHHILPYAEQEIVRDCVSHMAQTAEVLSKVEDFLEGQTKEAFSCVTEITGGKSISVEAFQKQHIVIQERILLGILKELAPGHKDVNAVHVMALLDLFGKESGRQVSLPFGIVGRRQYERVILENTGEPQISNQTIFEADCLSELSQGATSREIRISDTEKFIFRLCQKDKEFPQNQYTKWFDYDKIEQSLQIRSRQAGDYLSFCDIGGLRHKKLKDYLITEKIPRSLRESLRILAEGNHVLWLVGYRISEYYKVSDETKTVLEVEYISEQFTEDE